VRRCAGPPTPPTSRSASTAPPPCSTRRGGWSRRPSTSRSTSGRCPRPCGGLDTFGDLARRPGARLRPVRRRHPPAGLDAGRARSDVEDGRCSATPRTVPTTPTSGAPRPGRCPPAPPRSSPRACGSRRSEACPSRARRTATSSRCCSPTPAPRGAARRPARAGRREPPGRTPAARAGGRPRPRRPGRRDGRDAGPRGTAGPRRAGEAPAGRDLPFEDVLDDDGTDRTDVPIRATVTMAGDRITVDLPAAPTRSPGSVNAPLAVTVSAASTRCGRCSPPTCRPTTARPVRWRSRRRSAASSTPPAGSGGGRQRGDLAADRRRAAGRAGAAGPRPGPRRQPGHDEQHAARRDRPADRRGVHLLRDAGRRLGCRPVGTRERAACRST
jgi:hypothetical protein